MVFQRTFTQRQHITGNGVYQTLPAGCIERFVGKHIICKCDTQPPRLIVKSHIEARKPRRIDQHHAMRFSAPGTVRYRRIGKSEIEHAIPRHAPARQHANMLAALRRKAFHGIAIERDDFGHRSLHFTSRRGIQRHAAFANDGATASQA